MSNKTQIGPFYILVNFTQSKLLSIISFQILFTRNSAAIYDASTDTWTAAASMKYGRTGMNLVANNGKIVAMGGFEKATSDVVEVYDPAKNTW